MKKDGMEKENNIIIMIKQYMIENISIEKEMEKEKNIMNSVNYYMMENI